MKTSINSLIPSNKEFAKRPTSRDFRRNKMRKSNVWTAPKTIKGFRPQTNNKQS